MIARVSKFKGASGQRKIGRVSGSSPMSPTVRISRPRTMATAVIARMHTSGEGMTLPILGT
ncbi:hypothetical protein D3C78_1994870 [compost metagenome]